MTTFVQAAMGNVAPAVNRAYARTENGMRALKSTMSANVDLFGTVGAARGRNLTQAFELAFQENPDVAIRVAQYARDIREGQGERKFYRDVLRHLERTRPDILLDSRLLENVAEIGRFDDLLIFNTDAVKAKAYAIYARALSEGNGLAAKWAPRKGQVAVELRTFLGLTPKQYRKLVVRLTNVVETQMCAKNFNEINFSHVPSQAMSRYMTAFHRNAPEAFQAYKDALKRPDAKAKGVKVNAGAVYPYTPIKMLGTYGYRNSGNEIVANEMWKNLPDFMNDTAVMPMVDVSGSMWTPVADATALDIAVSLGLYCSERTKNAAFKDLFLTFSGSPRFVKTSGTLSQRINQMVTSNWAMNTNLHAAFDKILDVAVRGNVPESEMPKVLLILSDMQFDACAHYDDSAMQMIRRKYEAAGYALPAIVFWNLRDAGNKPVRFNEKGVALVGGFSPSIMKAVLSADLNDFTPESVMMKTVMKDRYSW